MVNNFFVNACPDIIINEALAVSKIKNNSNSLFLRPADADEVYKTILALKNKKSTGYDEIPVTLLKQTTREIAPVLSHIINLCFSTGIFPEQLKQAQIKSVYKKGEKIILATIDR